MTAVEPFYYVAREYERAIEQYRKALDSLRSDPRFKDLLRRVGLVPD